MADTAPLTAQNRYLPPLVTEDFPDPLPTDPPILSPPPAYYPPPPGPNNLFNSPYYNFEQSFQNLQAFQTPEQNALQQQYTEYFTQLFTKWIDYGVFFYKYGFPLIKWSSFFFIRGTGGWREAFLWVVWGKIWVVPGLYWGLLGKELEDVKNFGMNKRGREWLIYQTVFWVCWAVIVSFKFVVLAFIMRIQSWWMWPVFGLWLCVFRW